MKSRILAVAGVVLASATLAACGDNTPDDDTDVVVPPAVIEPAPAPMTPDPIPAPTPDPVPVPDPAPIEPAPIEPAPLPAPAGP